MKTLLNKSIFSNPFLSLGLLLLPGGSVLTLLLWLYNHRHQEA